MKRVVQLERVSTTDAQKEAEAQAQIIVWQREKELRVF